MPIGELNPCAFQCGGGPTLPEKIYEQLRSGLGKNGAGPEDGIEDRWRQAKALAIAKALDVQERAAMQAFPNLGVEHLPIYEAILGLREGENLADRTDAVTAAYVGVPDATDPGLEAALQRIDSTISLVVVDATESLVAHFGKPFQIGAATQDPAEWPAYSEHLFAFIHWPVIDETKRPLVERLLNKSLPSWCDWVIYQSVGFVLDESPLDVTFLGG